MNTNTPPSSNEGLSETKKVPPQASVKEQITGIVVVIILGVCLASVFVGWGTSTQSPETSAPVAEVEQDNSSKHYSYVLDFVKSKATHPSTVDFCSVLNRVVKTEKQPDGSTLYAYRNCMTAENSYGAELKYDWVVVIQESVDRSVKVINSDIKEE